MLGSKSTAIWINSSLKGSLKIGKQMGCDMRVLLPASGHSRDEMGKQKGACEPIQPLHAPL